jgi:hypothetical protein
LLGPSYERFRAASYENSLLDIVLTATLQVARFFDSVLLMLSKGFFLEGSDGPSETSSGSGGKAQAKANATMSTRWGLPLVSIVGGTLDMAIRTI